MAAFSSLRAWIKALLNNRPYVLLVLTMLMWSANGNAGRLAIDQISPMMIVSLRWLIASSVLIFFARDQIRNDWKILKQHPVIIGFGGTFGFTGFNALFYLAAHHTSAVNMTILQGSLPVFVLLGAALVYRLPVSLMEWMGVGLTLCGVGIVAIQGDLSAIAKFSFNIGDGWLILACLIYSAYALALRNRPKVSGIGFFTVLAIAAFISSLPLLIWESALGETQWPTSEGWLLLLFIALFPSLLAQICFLRAVDLIGPGRASIFTNLVPIFGPMIAVGLLGETFHPFHAVALVLVLLGIALAEWRKIRPLTNVTA